MKVSVRFKHGLGDCANFAHLIPLYIRRGHEVEIETDPDKAPMFRAAGAKIVSRAEHHHHWHHPSIPTVNRLDAPWSGNKVGYGISQRPMPDIGDASERWDELVLSRVDFSSEAVPTVKHWIDDLFRALPDRPVILLHTQGNTSPDRKNYPERETRELYTRLIDETDATLVLLDWDNRAPRIRTQRIFHLHEEFGLPGLAELYELMQRASLFVGVDSGPLHFCRLTEVPAIGLWTHHYPSHFSLPRDLTLNVVSPAHRTGNKFHRAPFNTACSPGDEHGEDRFRIDPAFLTKLIAARLSGPKYLFEPGQVMRDVQLQNFIDLTRSTVNHQGGYVDRHRSFDLALRRLKNCERPLIVETGCIRAEEDWAGAGFATYLFGAYAWQRGGEVRSVELDNHNVQFARTWTQQFGQTVQVHEQHSHNFLRAWPADKAIDLFYSDSADVGTPGFMECCLVECRKAAPLVSPGGMILIDDTVYGSRHWGGKGTLAVPWLLSNGWRIVYAGYQVLLERVSL